MRTEVGVERGIDETAHGSRANVSESSERDIGPKCELQTSTRGVLGPPEQGSRSSGQESSSRVCENGNGAFAESNYEPLSDPFGRAALVSQH